MSGLFSPVITIAKTVDQTVAGMISILRRIAFVVEDTFSFGDFNPQINWNGMTVTAYVLHEARYLKIFNMLWVSIAFEATLATPFSNQVVVTLPAITRGPANNKQFVSGYVQNAGAGALGILQANGASNQLLFFRSGFSAYTAGSGFWATNAFFEVM